MTAPVHVCAWPRCKASVLPSQFITVVGEKTGRIYACDAHREKLSLGKAIVGAGLVAGFQVGMDRAAPGLREKIYTVGSGLFGLIGDIKASMQKDREREPAE